MPPLPPSGYAPEEDDATQNEDDRDKLNLRITGVVCR